MFAGWKGADKKPIQQPDWSLLELLEFHLRHLRPMMKNLELFHVIYDPWFFYDNCHCFWGTDGYIYIYYDILLQPCVDKPMYHVYIYIYILLYITVSYYILLYMIIYHYILYIVYIIIILSVINCYKSHDYHPTGGVPKKNPQSGFH